VGGGLATLAAALGSGAASFLFWRDYNKAYQTFRVGAYYNPPRGEGKEHIERSAMLSIGFGACAAALAETSIILFAASGGAFDPSDGAPE
jgi:hypothetical protein